MSGKKHIPMRTCIVTREKKPKSELIRFVLDADSGNVMLDPTGKLNGRGANISMSLQVFDQAVERKAFERAFKAKINKENLESLRKEVELYINKVDFRKGQKQVTVRIEGEPIKIS